MKIQFLFFPLLSLCFSHAFAQEKLETNDLSSLYKTTSYKQISVHDPSVFWDSKTQKFYIYGSHYSGASSSDLRNWDNWGMWGTYYNTGKDAYSAFTKNPTHKVMRCLPGSTQQEEVTLKSFNSSDYCACYSTDKKGWINGNQWAPDVIYNPNMGKYCYYLSLNGDKWASVIVLMTSNSITGPYTYQGPIVFGGFNGEANAPKYTDTDMNLVLGDITSLPSRYKVGDKWGSYYPNPIDPCVFFDEDGELWMSYGSWSGGIFMLKLDKQTGLRDYTYTYQGTGTSANANALSDAYFGKKIAGGYYVSGEGSYIQHIGDYYYLFMSYGFFDPNGGYEMRVFRSDKPDGPYKDASGNVATYTSYQMNYGPRASTNKGMKLMGAMNNWGTMTVGECAQGHNSACVDDEGRSYLVCHTKFNNGTAGHSVRSYQLYLNKSGWLVAAPFQYNGETVNDEYLASNQPYSVEDVEGDYHVIFHPYKLNYEEYEESTPKSIHLSSSGKITGDYTGTWKYTDEGKSYVQLTINSVTYSGVVVEQTLENNTAKVLCFTTVSNSGVPCWGYKLQPSSAIAYNYLQNTDRFKASLFSYVSKNVNVMFDTKENVELTWQSSDPDVISNTGKYNAPAEDVSLTLTARLSCGNYYWEHEFSSTARAATEVTGDQTTGLVAYYNFDESPTANLYNSEETAYYYRSGSGVKATLEEDYSRFGKVVHQNFGAIGNNSFCRIQNPLLDKKLDGFTVSLWVKRTDLNEWDALWGFFDALNPKTESPRLFLTGNTYLGFNDNAGSWFDINHPDKKSQSTTIKVGEWSLVTFTLSKENGYTLYVDGSRKAYLSSSATSYAGSVDDKKAFDYGHAIDVVTSLKYFYLGMGSFWGSADASFDDLMIYDRELSDVDVKGLNTLLNRVNDFSPEATVIEGVRTEAPDASNTCASGTYDLYGRKVAVPSRGIYIQNGKKVLVR